MTTPIREYYSREYPPIGRFWMKRDDLFEVAGQYGGKARTAWHIATTPNPPTEGLVTAGSRQSPQVNIVAHIAKHLGLKCTIFTPKGKWTPEIREALDCGARRVTCNPGFNTHLAFRAKRYAQRKGPSWREIPFGMETMEAVNQTMAEVQNIPREVKRIVIPLGSGMSAAGVLTGLLLEWQFTKRRIPVVGVLVGADPTRRLDQYAPLFWKLEMEMVGSMKGYYKPATRTTLAGVKLDPHYEAKCIPYLMEDDLLWVVGLRSSERGK